MSTAIAIYVHLPWCVRKCPYCDFNSHAAPERIPEMTYVKALLADLDADLDLAAGRSVASVFLGGGTPSLFGTEAIGTLLAGIASRLPFAADVEITMEANPGTVEHGRFEGYAAAGVNRVSLGAQSFDAARLKALGRIHGPEEIGIAVSELRAASITNFNLDLMYALPEQTTAGALSDLAAAIALGPAHLSHYQLTLEPGTAFYHRPPPLPDDDQAFEMQQACQQMLAAAGYAQYEVSAYARPGRQCRHNLNYWRFGDYLGIGAGAHGKVTVGRAGHPHRKDAHAARVPAARRAKAPAARHAPDGSRGGAAIRVHAECAAPARRIRARRFRARTGLPARRSNPTLAGLAGARTDGRNRRPMEAHGARIPLPERPPGGISARR